MTSQVPIPVRDEPAPTVCHRLRVSYHKPTDSICIEHYSLSGALLSECNLAPEDALDYAKTINEVYDEAYEVE